MKKKILAGAVSFLLIGTFFLIQPVLGRSYPATENGSSVLSSSVSVQPNAQSGSSESKKEIFGTVNTENTWAVDPKIASNLIDENSSVVKLRVLSIGDAKILPAKGNFYNPEQPYTPIEVDILKTLSGSTLKGKMTVYMRGGDITVSDLMKTLDEASAKKMELNSVSESKRDSVYLSYITGYDYKLNVGKEYAVILGKAAENLYMITANGYGIFQADSKPTVDKTGGTETFNNVLTGNKLKVS